MPAVTWEIQVANKAHYRLFPWAAPWAENPETSILRMIFRPESRDSLLRWREDWAGPMVDLIRSALHTHPGHAGLSAQVRGVLAADPEARALWAERERVGLPRLHPDTRVRQVRHPDHGVLDVVPLLLSPEPVRGHRLVILAPPAWADMPARERYGLGPEDLTDADRRYLDDDGADDG
jgi:hypothetical protein